MNLLESKALSTPARRIDDFSREYDCYGTRLTFEELVDQMFLTTEEKNGVGLAAPQIGLEIQLAVVKYQGLHLVLVNPKWDLAGVKDTEIEGCLSLPHKYSVRRAGTVRVTTETLDGRTFTFIAKGHLARIVQHEIDHLVGVTIEESGHKIQ